MTQNAYNNPGHMGKDFDLSFNFPIVQLEGAGKTSYPLTV